MGNIFFDAFSSPIINGGTIQCVLRTTIYAHGFGSNTEKKVPFIAKKSAQPLTPDEATKMGFGDYGSNEWLIIYSTKKIPMPSGSGENMTIEFNKKEWYVRKVLPWTWDEGTQLERGYYKVYLSRFEETKVNPN